MLELMPPPRGMVLSSIGTEVEGCGGQNYPESAGAQLNMSVHPGQRSVHTDSGAATDAFQTSVGRHTPPLCSLCSGR
jgi:hypothetical protein